MTEEAKKDISEGKPQAYVRSVLYPLTLLASFVQLGLVMAELLSIGAFKQRFSMSTLYLALLAAYATDKEVRRWNGEEPPGRRGEIFIYIWWVLVLIVIVLVNADARFTMPTDLPIIAYQVLAVFFGTSASKVLYKRRSGRISLERGFIDVPDAEVIAYIRQNGKITSQGCAELLGISKRQAVRLLTVMCNDGQILRKAESPTDPDSSYILPS